MQCPDTTITVISMGGSPLCSDPTAAFALFLLVGFFLVNTHYQVRLRYELFLEKRELKKLEEQKMLFKEQEEQDQPLL